MQASRSPADDRAHERPAAIKDRGSLGTGIGLVCLLHVLQILFVLEDPAMLAFAGITQLAYVLPAALVLVFRGRWRSALGALYGAALTFAVNALVVVLL